MRGPRAKRGIAHQFRNVQKPQRGGWSFDSKKEAARFDSLTLAQEAGEVLFFLRQAPFHLPGHLRYLVDFIVFWADGTVTFEDVKSQGGYRTEKYQLKKKLVEDVYYPVTITEV